MSGKNAKEDLHMEDTFDSAYIIRKERYKEFMTEVAKMALAAYIIPAFV